MQLVSFDPLRTWDIPGVKTVKPENWAQARPHIQSADWVLFPEYEHVNRLVYGHQKRIFPSPSTYHLGYDKAEMTSAFEAVAPACVPYTLVLPATPSNIEVIWDELPLPFVAKDIRNARGKGVFLIQNRADWLAYAQAHGRVILYAQEYLPITRDVRVVYVGDQVLTAYWRIAPEGGFHNNVAQGGHISFEDVPSEALDLTHFVAQALRINHAGFDIAFVDKQPYLLEFNMRFGNQALREQNIRLGTHIYAYLHANT